MNHKSKIIKASDSTTTGVPIATPRLGVLELELDVVFGAGIPETFKAEVKVCVKEVADERVVAGPGEMMAAVAVLETLSAKILVTAGTSEIFMATYLK